MPLCPLSDEKILKMIEEGDEFCDHRGSIITSSDFGSWNRTMCCRCLRFTQESFPNPARASEELLEEAQQNIKRYKEIKMAQPTYEDGYKQGVEDATQPFTTDDFSGCPITGIGNFNTTILPDRRKKLLTKKVTKWVNVWGTETAAYIGRTALYNSKEVAWGTAKVLDLSNYLGTYSIEIEVPL